VAFNVNGALGAALFARVTLEYFLRTHRLIGGAFLFEQTWVVGAYLFRRRARVVTQRVGDWLVAFVGTFAGVLLRPGGPFVWWGAQMGQALQLIGLVICIAAFLTLGRSFGFAPADRGLVRRGPYALVRHPIYAGYLVLQVGYLLQSFSMRNIVVVVVITGCNVARARAEERLLCSDPHFAEYRATTRWRLMPGAW
jgi:protein-S-isoprenylcysteine O-methyltransferase Ste14